MQLRQESLKLLGFFLCVFCDAVAAQRTIYGHMNIYVRSETEEDATRTYVCCNRVP